MKILLTPAGVLSIILLLQSFQLGLCVLKPGQSGLFPGNKVKDFYDYCTSKSKLSCDLSSPEDFQRLRDTKKYMQDILDFYRSRVRLFVLLGLQGFIMVLMIHLTIVRHFDWRSLPIINLRYDKEQYQDKTHGVTYQQYIWMRNLVLRGSHPVFEGRDYREVNWYKYKKAKDFDYNSVHIRHFTFLDKKTLTKHLVEDLDKDDKDKEDADTSRGQHQQ